MSIGRAARRALIVLPFAVAAAAVVVPRLADSGPQTYYVSARGSDGANGTSPETAWKTLGRASQQRLYAGDVVRLQSGNTFSGSLTITSSGTADRRILVRSYGSGSKPRVTGGCVDVLGSWVSVRGLDVWNCSWAGISVGGDHVTVAGNRVRGNVTGVYVRPGSTDARVARNSIINNNRMSVNTPGGDDDSGAFGVLVRGDRAEVARNVIAGHAAPSFDYGTDGSAVEIYGAIGTRVHHNIARDNETFTELGDPRSADNLFAYNVVTSDLPSSEFLITRGAQSGWGPIPGTVGEYNTVRLTGANSEGFVCYSGCSPQILDLHSNVIVAVKKVGYADHDFDSARNVYFGGQRQFTMGRSDTSSAPVFAAAARNNLRLVPGSPGIDKGGHTDWQHDINGRQVPFDGDGDGVAAPDAGAYETRG